MKKESKTHEQITKKADSINVSDKTKDKKRVSLTAITDQIKIFRTLVTNLFIIFFLLLIFVFIVIEIFKERTIIEPFEIPYELSEKGFTGSVLANRLLDHINNMNIKHKTLMENKKNELEWLVSSLSSSILEDQESSERIGGGLTHGIELLENQNLNDIEVPTTGISFSSVRDLLKEYIGSKPKRITGGLVLHGEDTVTLTIRIHGHIEESFSGSLDRLDTLLLQSAKYILKRTQPYILASYQYASGDYRGCIETIEYCNQNKLIYELIDEENKPMLFNLWGNILRNNKEYEKAMEKYQRAVELNPRNAFAYNNMGVILCMQEKYKEALMMYETAIDIKSDYVEAYINRGRVYDNMGKSEKANEEYQKANELDKFYAHIRYNNLGLILFSQKEYNEAIKNYEKAIEINPNYAAAYNNWGLVLHELKEYYKAVDKFNIAINLDSSYADAHSNLGTTYYYLKKYKEAITECRKALELKPNNVHVIHNNIGQSLFSQSRYDEAIEEYKKAIEYDSSYATAYLNWGVALYRKKNYDKAINMYEKAMECNPLSPEYIHNAWGLALFRKEKYDEAIEKFKHSIKLSPNFSLPYFNYGCLLQEIGYYEDAIEKYNKFLELDPESPLVEGAKNRIRKSKNMIVQIEESDWEDLEND